MSRIDLDAVDGEANEEPHAVTWKGREYIVPRIVDWDAEAIDKIEQGMLAAAFRLILGDTQYREFVKGRPRIRHYNALMEQIEQAEGLSDPDGDGGGPGNSSRSARSSRSTPGPSKRTSRGTTKSGSRASTPAS